MASPLYLAQQLFSAISNNAPQAPAGTCINGTLSNDTISYDQTQSMGFPVDLPSLINLLISFSALREWFKILVFGSVLETLRRLAFHFYYKIYNSFFITARFEEDDSSYGMFLKAHVANLF